MEGGGSDGVWVRGWDGRAKELGVEEIEWVKGLVGMGLRVGCTEVCDQFFQPLVEVRAAKHS